MNAEIAVVTRSRQALAIVVSIAAHAAVMVLLAGVTTQSPAPAHEVTRITVGMVAAEAGPRARGASPVVHAAPVPAAPVRKPRPRAWRPPAARAISARTTATTTVAPAAPVASSESPVAGAVGAAGNGSQPGAGGGSGGTAPAGGNVDPDRVRHAIESAIQYPRLARRRQVAGRVTVRFFVDQRGAPTRLQVLSSAHPLLERAARKAVARAAPYAPNIGWIRVPIQFSLVR